MTLEVLFAAAGQSRTFLLMGLLGAAMTLLIHMSGSLHRVCKPLGMTADLLIAVIFALCGTWIILGSGEGLRLYGLLGLCIGGALYLGGGAPLVDWLAGILRKIHQHMHTGGTKG
nr:hypothetical protein [Clostridia bacterium]